MYLFELVFLFFPDIYLGVGDTQESVDMSLSELRELVMDRRPGVLRFMGLQRVGHD